MMINKVRCRDGQVIIIKSNSMTISLKILMVQSTILMMKNKIYLKNKKNIFYNTYVLIILRGKEQSFFKVIMKAIKKMIPRKSNQHK